MRILYVQDTDWIRRNPIQHTHLAERLALRGHEVRAIDYEILWRTEGKKELLSRRQVFHVSRTLPGATVTVVRPPILKIPLLDYVSMLVTYGREIDRQMQEFGPDLVLGNDLLTTFLAFRAARRQGIPSVFYAIDVEHRLVPFRFLRPIGKLMESRNIRTADLVLSINEGLREHTVRMGAAPEKTRVLRAGIDPGVFQAGTDGSAVRAEYGLDDADIVLFFMGWLYHFSGLKELVADIASLGNGRMKLLIVGDGDAFGDIRDMREKLGLQEKVVLAGRQPYERIPGFIAASDICLLPAYPHEKTMQDIVPIKMYEYMAMGKPVIATRLPGIVKEFGPDNGVVYVDGPRDVLARAAELVQNGTMSELGSKAKTFASRNTWDAITDEFEQILEQAVKEKHSPNLQTPNLEPRT